MPDKRHPAPGHCLWWHGTAGKVAACPTEAKTGAQTCRQCVPCCGDSMWSVRTACCSTGDCGTSSTRGDGPISLKAVHLNVILACCLTGAASAGAAAWLCRVAQAPGGTSSGTSSSPGSPPPVFSIPGRLRRTKRPRAGRFAFEECTCPLQRRMGMTRTGRSSSSTQTHFCRRLRGLPRGGNQPWCSSSLGLVCMCAVPVTQSSAMVFSSDARGVFRESPLLIPPAGSRAAGNGKRGCRHQGPRKGHCAPAAPCRRGGCECLHFCICESSARCDLSLLA